MNFSQIRIARFLKNVFPPSSAGIFSPGEFEERVRLIYNALPKSLALSRMRINQIFTVNPATVLNTVQVPPDRYWYVHAADFTLFSGVPTSTNLAQIRVVDPIGVDQSVTMASGAFTTVADTSKVFTHAGGNLTQVSVGVPTIGGGGGTGGFIVPAGHVLQGVTAQVPGTAVYRLNWLFVEMLDGEEVPDFS